MVIPEPFGVLVFTLYYGLLVGGFAFYLQWESGAARIPFPTVAGRWKHVLNNLFMLLLVLLIADLLVGELLLGASRYVYEAPDIWLQAYTLPLPLQIVMALVLSDLFDYGLHRASHKIGWLWRLHAVHHTDNHLDVTTAMRSHPLEISVHVVAKIAFYALLGLPLVLEGMRAVLLNLLLYVQHANVNYPAGMERLRVVLVTPAMHRLHHDPGQPLIESNFGLFFSFWDRLFGTYRSPDASVASGMGVAGHQGENWQSIAGMLLTPWNLNFRSSDR